MGIFKRGGKEQVVPAPPHHHQHDAHQGSHQHEQQYQQAGGSGGGTGRHYGRGQEPSPHTSPKGVASPKAWGRPDDHRDEQQQQQQQQQQYSRDRDRSEGGGVDERVSNSGAHAQHRPEPPPPEKHKRSGFAGLFKRHHHSSKDHAKDQIVPTAQHVGQHGDPHQGHGLASPSRAGAREHPNSHMLKSSEGGARSGGGGGAAEGGGWSGGGAGEGGSRYRGGAAEREERPSPAKQSGGSFMKLLTRRKSKVSLWCACMRTCISRGMG